MNLTIASNNTHKIKEIEAVLPEGIHVTDLAHTGIKGEIPENEPTLEGNALAKARYVYKITGGAVFADDTGLEVEQLNNRPGVHSARYAGEQRSSSDNIRLLLREMVDNKNRKARFRTVIALIIDGEEFLFEGMVNGEITREPKGSGGFGYDPVFIPEGYTQTFAEMPQVEKNLVSHRSRAVAKLVCFLEEATGNKI